MDNLHIFLGATVADAATRPLHWVYDPKKLKKYIKGKKEIAFLKKKQKSFLFNKNWKSIWLQRYRTGYVQDINSN